jgi:tRNA 2-thiocytidine biosynthesis protein TtcA
MKHDILPRQINKRIGRAMHDYEMLRDGDRVLVAASGGVDSTVLAWVLKMWRQKAPISYELEAIHIDAGFWRQEEGDERPVERIAAQLRRLGVDFSVIKGREAELTSCFSCAMQRRNQLFDLARDRGYTKIAFGHHKDDLVETLFLNMLYSGNISTMVPRQDLFEGGLSLIRPLAYVEKDEIRSLARKLRIEPVENLCPLAGDTRRETVRRLLAGIYKEMPGAKSSIFAAMANVRDDYILKVTHENSD